jgi:very-short-patch-repair endonuclease
MRRRENGYFVLRFLAEDAGKELDVVLDAILRALSRRRGTPSLPLAIAHVSS